ncbi:hypothetical protein SAGO17_00104 [Mimivirus AB-566-O17]|uniref:Uncharacterized protein n=1 Tax=Mimivirus AB-566-O17 TaxID=1988039 RepID=A0A1X9VNW3_9VIRU|nr:hypothetical protein SAGO17_00104 [Mimivirus AB-566-O17]
MARFMMYVMSFSRNLGIILFHDLKCVITRSMTIFCSCSHSRFRISLIFSSRSMLLHLYYNELKRDLVFVCEYPQAH